MGESVDSPRRRAAEKMSDLEREDRMFELNELYKNWRNSEDRDLQEQMELLQVLARLNLYYKSFYYLLYIGFMISILSLFSWKYKLMILDHFQAIRFFFSKNSELLLQI